MKFENDYQKREWLGRRALKELELNDNIQFTPDECPYDAFYFIYDNNMSIKKRVFIEIKIRDIDWDKPWLEWKKWNSITRIAKVDLHLKDAEYEILYINFLPTETIIWKVKEMDSKKLIVRKMNKATSTSRSLKIDKKVWELDKSAGKRIKYILNEKKLLTNNLIKNIIEESSVKIKKGLNDILFG